MPDIDSALGPWSEVSLLSALLVSSGVDIVVVLGFGTMFWVVVSNSLAMGVFFASAYEFYYIAE